MNDVTTADNTADMNRVVEDGARFFEDIEMKLTRQHDRILQLAPVWQEANSLGMMGMLETGELVNETRAIAGLLAEALARTFRLHQRGTAIAVKMNCDIPVPMGGGGGR